MVMLIPLGLLGLGAILSGMIWYSSFFGKDYQVANFFGIESEYQQTLPISKEENIVEKNNEKLEDAFPPQGAIYMSPENHV